MDNVDLIKTKVYAVRLKNKSLLLKSSSGGAFTAISDVFLGNGDVVVCAIYDYDTHFVRYKLITNTTQRDEARGSKYVQCILGDIFRISYEWLQEHPEKRLLFIGMGCQADAFRKYANTMDIRSRVWIVDIICHGSPSPKILRDYIVNKEKIGKITEVNFRAKRKNGWKNPTSYIIVNGREIKINDYMKVFYGGYALRPSCHLCPYTTTKRKVDLTIGDYWHIEERMPDFFDIRGNSLLLIHTTRGLELFEKMKLAIEFKESNIEDCWQKNLEKPTEMSLQREAFWNDYRSLGEKTIMKKYGHTPFGQKVYNKMKKIRGGGSITYLIPQKKIAVFSERRAA